MTESRAGHRSRGENPSAHGDDTVDASAGRSVSSPDAGAGPITLLHVDDEPEIGALVAAFLERADEDVTVLTETTAEDGLDRIEEGGVDCVVSDYEMPNTDGLAFLRRVRRAHPDLPFILFTWHRPEEVECEPDADALDGLFRKDYDLSRCELLVERVKELVEPPRSGTRAVADD